MQLLDTGTLVDALPDEGLAADTVGTIVHIFERPNRAFQVEFTDDDVETVAFVALLPAALRPCDRRTATNMAPVAPTSTAAVVSGQPRHRHVVACAPRTKVR
ncbi:MAG TPA: DUF4926 domain-containing protein [Actinoplanes sp.]|nr:DUF4926 domain-containing protein [Actinoplanes sp.]